MISALNVRRGKDCDCLTFEASLPATALGNSNNDEVCNLVYRLKDSVNITFEIVDVFINSVFLCSCSRWMDDNWSQDQEKTPEDNYLVKNQPFLEILKELHSLVFEFVEEFLNWILSVWFPKTSFIQTVPLRLGPSLHFVQWHVIYNSVLSKLNVFFFPRGFSSNNNC